MLDLTRQIDIGPSNDPFWTKIWQETATQAPSTPFPLPPPPTPPVPPAPTAPKWISASELCGKQFPPVKYIVDGFIAEGLTLLAGKPKVGKSWLALEIALAVASGTACLGDASCEQGDVLYLALEDNERRLDSRIRKVWTLEGVAGRPIPPNLYLSTEWPRANQGGIAGIRQWIAAHPAARLIIIDVLAMFKSVTGSKDATLYEADYLAIKELHQVAMQEGIGIVVIHHTRKSGAESDPFEKVSGTLGLSGAADSTVILDRDQNGVTLYGRGRDIEEFNRALVFERLNCRWKVLGNADDVRRTDERSVILDLLKDSDEGMTPTEIADALGLNRNNIKQLLFKMSKTGEIIKVSRGKYINPANQDYDGDKPPFAIGADDE